MSYYQPQSVFFASNKDVFDLFMSSKGQFSRKFIRNFLASRGILTSENEMPVELYLYTSRLELSFRDRLELEQQIIVGERVNSVRTHRLPTKMDPEKLKRITDELVKRRSDQRETIRPETTSEGMGIFYSYQEIDYGKNTLKQNREREMTLEISSSGEGICITAPANSKAEELIKDIQQAIEKEDSKSGDIKT